MGYLTNTCLSNKSSCEYAAKKSGMDVEFRDYPIPKDYPDLEDEYYHPEGMFGVYGSVYTNEGFADHSPFWRAWEEYE
jgi:hypothetical protein